jgi:hypothetical protein
MTIKRILCVLVLCGAVVTTVAQRRPATPNRDTMRTTPPIAGGPQTATGARTGPSLTKK